MNVRLAAVVVAADAQRWRAIGFEVDAGGRIALANGAIDLVDPANADGTQPFLRVASLDKPVADLDGVRVEPGAVTRGSDHPNGVFELDHIVVLTDSIARTSDSIADRLGLPQLRLRETDQVRQAFHRFPDRGCIIELVESDRVQGATLWGVVATTADLERFVAEAGPDLVGESKAAVQPGRRIATMRAGAGLGLAVAVMSPAI